MFRPQDVRDTVAPVRTPESPETTVRCTRGSTCFARASTAPPPFAFLSRPRGWPRPRVSGAAQSTAQIQERWSWSSGTKKYKVNAAETAHMSGCTSRTRPCTARIRQYAMKPKPIPFVIE